VAFNLRRVSLALILALLFSAACTSSDPTLPAPDDPIAIHDTLVGPQGQDFLSKITTHDWPDDGARAGEIFAWIPRDASSLDPAASTRAGEAAHALASFLGANHSPLLSISTGWFGLDHTTAGDLNPKLVQAYAAALVPFQGALACYSGDVRGFESLGKDCSSALANARNALAVLNTDRQAATSFAEAAYKQMDTYFSRFASGVLEPSHRFNEGPVTAGRLLGLLQAASSQSGIKVRAPLEEASQANFLLAKALIASDPNSGIPAEYFSGGALMSPTEIREKLGADAVAGYDDSLRTYLTNRNNVESFISHDFYDTYRDVAGAN
jgi:hypothetical protein